MYNKIMLENFRLAGTPTWFKNNGYVEDVRFNGVEKVYFDKNEKTLTLDEDKFDIINYVEEHSYIRVSFLVPELNGRSVHSCILFYCL